MSHKPSDDHLSVSELQRLLVEKRRTARQERLEQFRRTGRVIVVKTEAASTGLSSLTTQETGVEEEIEARRQKRSRWIDRLLLVVEAVAVLGLLYVLMSGVSLVSDLNREVRQALVQPTLTPTPLIVAVVLPSGHTPPNASGESQPNEAEIPDELRPYADELEKLPSPTPPAEVATRIQIPAIEVDAPIVQGDGWEDLKNGVGQHPGTPGPGQPGNIVLSAHNDVYGEVFRYLDQLEPGDAVTLFAGDRQYTYVITGSEIVQPTQVDVMAQTEEATITLISCYPYLVDRQRIVVTAKLEESS